MTTTKHPSEKYNLVISPGMSHLARESFIAENILVETAQKVIIATLFVCFVALRPKSTAMVIAGRSVHLTTLFPGQA